MTGTVVGIIGAIVGVIGLYFLAQQSILAIRRQRSEEVGREVAKAASLLEGEIADRDRQLAARDRRIEVLERRLEQRETRIEQLEDELRRAGR